MDSKRKVYIDFVKVISMFMVYLIIGLAEESAQQYQLWAG